MNKNEKRRYYQKGYYKKYYAVKKSYKIIYLTIVMKEYNKSNLLLNKTRQIVYFNYFVSVFHVLLSNK